MDVTDNEKHSSLLRHKINYDRKKFYGTGPEVDAIKRFSSASATLRTNSLMNNSTSLYILCRPNVSRPDGFRQKDSEPSVID